LELILAAEPRGPYRLLGWSSGGGVAHALACQLQARGARVSLLAMLDAYPAEMWHDKPEPTAQDAWIAMLDEAEAAALQHVTQPLTEAELLRRVKQSGSSLAGFDDATLLRMSQVALDSMRSYRTARHARLHGDVLFFRAARRGAGAPEPSLWQPHVSGVLDVLDVDASHLQMCSPAALAAISTSLGPRL
jgi:thioesterase domain-containing protein